MNLCNLNGAFKNDLLLYQVMINVILVLYNWFLIRTLDTIGSSFILHPPPLSKILANHKYKSNRSKKVTETKKKKKTKKDP